MDKDKPTDITEERMENLTDPEASALFREAFYEEGKALEEEALAQPFEVDEERKEALRRRILEAAAGDMEAEAKDEEEPAETLPEPDKEESKKRKTRFSPALRWAAVVVLACVGVLGVSMTSQAKGSGLWSSIQRLIGVETRWEQENNGEDRSISDPEEYKTIGEIEEKLGIHMPQFFWWPGELKYKSGEIVDNGHSFLMVYQDEDEDRVVFFEGYNDDYDISVIKVWDGEGQIFYREYNGVNYTISEIENDNKEIWHNVTWTVNGTKFILSGAVSEEELENILKNIKN